MSKLPLLLALVAIIFSNIVNAQLDNSKFQILNISSKTQTQIGESYTMISLYVSSVIEDGQKQEFERDINSNPSIKATTVKAKSEIVLVVEKEYIQKLESFFSSMDIEVIDYSNSTIPNDFPKYVDTGDSKQDKAKFHEAKQAWIQKYPNRFEKIKHLDLN